MSSPTIPMGQAGFSGPVAFDYYPLLSCGDVVSRPGSVASGGGVMKRGTIVNFSAATGVVTAPTLAADCNAILVNDIDATSAAAGCLVYVSCKVKADAVIWPGALSHALVMEALRNVDILVETVEGITGATVKSASQDEAPPTEGDGGEEISPGRRG